MGFWTDERGQDLSEYVLLFAFIFLLSACLFVMNMRSVGAVWKTANTVTSQGANRAGER